MSDIINFTDRLTVQQSAKLIGTLDSLMRGHVAIVEAYNTFGQDPDFPIAAYQKYLANLQFGD